jgi:hypothetical protein
MITSHPLRLKRILNVYSPAMRAQPLSLLPGSQKSLLWLKTLVKFYTKPARNCNSVITWQRKPRTMPSTLHHPHRRQQHLALTIMNQLHRAVRRCYKATFSRLWPASRRVVIIRYLTTNRVSPFILPCLSHLFQTLSCMHSGSLRPTPLLIRAPARHYLIPSRRPSPSLPLCRKISSPLSSASCSLLLLLTRCLVANSLKLLLTRSRGLRVLFIHLKLVVRWLELSLLTPPRIMLLSALRCLPSCTPVTEHSRSRRALSIF